MNPAAPVTRTFISATLADRPDYPCISIAETPDRPDYPCISVAETPDRPDYPWGSWCSEANGSRDAPDVDDLPAVELERAVRAMRRADDQDVGLLEHPVHRLKGGVLDVWVGADDLRALELGKL